MSARWNRFDQTRMSDRELYASLGATLIVVLLTAMALGAAWVLRLTDASPVSTSRVRSLIRAEVKTECLYGGPVERDEVSR